MYCSSVGYVDGSSDPHENVTIFWNGNENEERKITACRATAHSPPPGKLPRK